MCSSILIVVWPIGRPYPAVASRVMTTEHVDVVVVGGGVVGVAAALALARRGASVVLLEARPGLALQATGTNSGVLHTGFDSTPGELETELILRAAAIRDPVLDALGVPVLRCGAVIEPRTAVERSVVDDLEHGARANGVTVERGADGSLAVPGESVTDPVALTLALAGAAIAAGADVRVACPLTGLRRDGGRLRVETAEGAPLSARVVVNAAGLRADAVAHMAGDDGFAIFPRKGEFLVFDPPGGEPPARILLPVPSPTTKGVLIFPTLDGRLAVGPTAHDQDDKDDWSVRPDGEAQVRAKLAERMPELADAEPLARYAGLRPAGRDANYVIAHSPACPGLIHAAAIRSTGLTAALAIAERLCALAGDAGVRLGPEAPLVPGDVPPGIGLDGPWWTRTARFEGGRRA